MHHIDVRIEKDVYDVNNTLADENARHLKAHGVRAFDLLGAIGSGKTPVSRWRGLTFTEVVTRVANRAREVASSEGVRIEVIAIDFH